jgi:acyl-CoA dehydrogenase
MVGLRFDLRDTPPEAPALRAELRAFLAEAGRDWSPMVRAYSWMAFDRDFSRAVGERGWIGMTWPKAYGGGERTAMDRYVVLEEMLAVGAPVAAHWIGDRQSGPLLLRLGTEEQRRNFLPGIVRGELAFAIGLSEPDSGSDLASLRTRAEKVPGGWKINGRKVWTTNAHRCDFMIALLRTEPVADPKLKHQGLSQFLVDLRSSGLSIRPILDLVGEEGFNEITFDDVFVPDSMLVGTPGKGWEQATAELAFERAGPERYLSSLPLLPAAVDALRADGAAGAETVGRLLARAGTLRQM